MESPWMMEVNRARSRDRMARSVDRCFGVAAVLISLYVIAFITAGFQLPSGSHLTLTTIIAAIAASGSWLLYLTARYTIPGFIQWLKGY